MLLFKNRFECIVAEEQENLNVNGIMEGRELLVTVGILMQVPIGYSVTPLRFVLMM